MASPIVVMGVSGSGKSTVGAALAQRLRVPFADADDYHPPANIAKMSAGQPLDDDDRYPWLAAIGERGKAVVDGIDSVSEAVFAVVNIIMRFAPLGAFGAMAFTVGRYGVSSLGPLVKLIGTFYLTTILFGPYGAVTLGDWGAEIIKVESLTGDGWRYSGQFRNRGMSGQFMAANRNKRSLALDLKHPDGSTGVTAK